MMLAYLYSFFKVVFIAVISVCSLLGLASAQTPPQLSNEQVASLLSQHTAKAEFPNFIDIPDFGYAKVNYTLDAELHDIVSKIYRSYRPDYASFVAIDPDTGKVLALSSFARETDDWLNLALGANYPAASIFKVITAAAAIDKNKVAIDTVIPFNGKSTTLYKRQTLAHKDNKYTRRPTFKEAFAKSTNPVFGRVGAQYLGKETVMEYVDRFGFEKPVLPGLQHEESHFLLPLDDEWELAEAGSGYTRDIRIGPLHAATMAATILNNGKQVNPFAVESIVDAKNTSLYEKPSLEFVDERVIEEQTADDLLKMMQETTRIGSARKAFRKAHRYKAFRGLRYGGKTGSLTGFYPKGKYDWFVGFAEKGDQRIAYASLIINKEKWYVKSSRVAFEVLNGYYKHLARVEKKAVEEAEMKSAKNLVDNEVLAQKSHKLDNK